MVARSLVETAGIALEDLAFPWTRAVRDAGANGCAMLACGVEAARGRLYREARKGHPEKQHDDRRSWHLLEFV